MTTINSFPLKSPEVPHNFTPPEAPPASPPSSFLDDIRKKESSIPINFITPNEEVLLKELFAQYHLTYKMDLIDFLGFCCYQELENLMETIGHITSTQETASNIENPSSIFCSNFTFYYYRVLRDCSNNKPASSAATMNKFSLPKTEFISSLESLYLKVNIKLKEAFAHIQKNLPTCSPVEKEKAMTLYRQGLDHLGRFKSLIDLFSKIALSPHSMTILIDYNLEHYPGSEKLEDITIKDANSILSEMPAIRDIQNFVKFINCCIDSTKTKWTGLIISYFSDHLKILQAHQTKTASTALIKSWNEIFCVSIENLFNTEKSMNRAYGLARTGQLTHQQWLIQNKLRPASQKTQETFTESLHITHLQAVLFMCWEESINRMMEQHLFNPLFSKVYRSRDKTMEYFLNKLPLVLLLAQKPLEPFADCPFQLISLVVSFFDEINQRLDPLHQFLQRPSLAADREALCKWYQEHKIVAFPQFVQFLADLKSGCALANTLLEQLPQLQKKLTLQLNEILKNTSWDEFQKEKTNWLGYIQAQYHFQSRIIFCYITYFKDLQFHFERATFLTDGNYTLPPELKSYLTFQTEIASIFEQAKTFLNPQDPVSLPEESEEILPPPSEQKAEETRAPSPPARNELIQRFNSATKVREFEAILKELNFHFARYRNGSDAVWRNNTTGNQVTLPGRPSADITAVRESLIKQAFDL